jgi:hypothetical protein
MGCALLGQGIAVIIVSEPSANATRRVRTGRFTPARTTSSAARNNTARYAGAPPISVHTEALSPATSAGWSRSSPSLWLCQSPAR